MIRPAEPGDLDRLLRIETAVFALDGLDRRALRHAIRSPTVASPVALADGEVVGYALLELRRGSGVARLTSVAVLPEAAGHGLGRALMGFCEDAAAAAGKTRVRLEVRADNARAIAIYRAARYREIGRREDYYEDGGAAIRLELDLPRPDAARG